MATARADSDHTAAAEAYATYTRELGESLLWAQNANVEAYDSFIERVTEASRGLSDDLATVHQRYLAELNEIGRSPIVEQTRHSYEALVAAALAAGEGGEQKAVRSAAQTYNDSLLELGRVISSSLTSAYDQYVDELALLGDTSTGVSATIADALDDYLKQLTATWQSLLDRQQNHRRELAEAASVGTTPRRARRAKKAADDSMLWPGAGEPADGPGTVDDDEPDR